jgi:hypothetical protein
MTVMRALFGFLVALTLFTVAGCDDDVAAPDMPSGGDMSGSVDMGGSPHD